MTAEMSGTYATALFLLIGSGFVLVGVIGLLKFNDPMTRLHAPTKVGTVGIGMLLLASMVHSFVLGETSIHELADHGVSVCDGTNFGKLHRQGEYPPSGL